MTVALGLFGPTYVTLHDDGRILVTMDSGRLRVSLDDAGVLAVTVQ